MENTSWYWISFFFWDSSTIVESTQGNRCKYLLTESGHVISDFYQNPVVFLIIVEICVEMMQNLGGWYRDNRNMQMW